MCYIRIPSVVGRARCDYPPREQEIYFLGVDLSSAGHFWDEPGDVAGPQFWVPPPPPGDSSAAAAAGRRHATADRGVAQYLHHLDARLSAARRGAATDPAAAAQVSPFLRLRRPFVNLAPASLLAACGLATADGAALFPKALRAGVLAGGHDAGADGRAGAAFSAAVWRGHGNATANDGGGGGVSGWSRNRDDNRCSSCKGGKT